MYHLGDVAGVSTLLEILDSRRVDSYVLRFGERFQPFWRFWASALDPPLPGGPMRVSTLLEILARRRGFRIFIIVIGEVSTLLEILA